MPARLMPFAPFDFACSTISGASAAATIIIESVGSWPWTIIFTSSGFNTPRFTFAFTGAGVPNNISDISVASIAPPHPSVRDVFKALVSIESGS